MENMENKDLFEEPLAEQSEVPVASEPEEPVNEYVETKLLGIEEIPLNFQVKNG